MRVFEMAMLLFYTSYFSYLRLAPLDFMSHMRLKCKIQRIRALNLIGGFLQSKLRIFSISHDRLKSIHPDEKLLKGINIKERISSIMLEGSH